MIWRNWEALIWPSATASYKLGHFRSKNGDSDNCGKLWAPVSVLKASTMWNNASAARLKLLYIA
jgi:hypothetical protein